LDWTTRPDEESRPPPEGGATSSGKHFTLVRENVIGRMRASALKDNPKTASVALEGESTFNWPERCEKI
jgi:hypothetical protein